MGEGDGGVGAKRATPWATTVTPQVAPDRDPRLENVEARMAEMLSQMVDLEDRVSDMNTQIKVLEEWGRCSRCGRVLSEVTSNPDYCSQAPYCPFSGIVMRTLRQL